MANELPGMSELLRFLQEQQDAEMAKFNKGIPRPPSSMSDVPQGERPVMSNVPQGKAMSAEHQFPTGNRQSMSNIPEQARPSSLGSVGNFNQSVRGSGAMAKQALSRASSPLALGVTASLANPAMRLGEAGADMLLGNMRDDQGEPVSKSSYRGQQLTRDRAVEKAGLPDIGEPLKTQSLRGSPPVPAKRPQLPPQEQSISARDDRPFYGPKESERLPDAKPASRTPVQESAEMAGLNYPEEEIVETVPDNEGQELESLQATGQNSASGVQADSAPPSARSEDDQVMAAIRELLSAKPPGPVQEDTSQSDAALAEVTKPNEQPKETFGHKVKRFFVAGSGPLNFSRIDEQEAGAKLAQQSMTDKEKAKANVASTDRAGAQSFNRQSQLLREGSGGMDDQKRAQLGFLMDQYKMATGESATMRRDDAQHKNRMTEIGAGAANQRISPEQQKRQAAYAVAEKNPDLFSSDQLHELLGVRPSPEALKVLQDARLKNDPMAMMLSQILAERFATMKGQGGATAKKPITVRALTEKTEPKK